MTKPLVSSDELHEMMRGRKMIKLSKIKSAMNKSSCDIEGDWVTIGVVLNKMTKTSKNGKEYSIWNLSDLSSEKYSVSFFLFGQTHEKHWKMSVGAAIGLLNASFMDKNSKNPKSSEIGPLTIDDPDKLLHIGTSKDLSHCKAIKKNGDICGSLIMNADDEFCLYHVKNAFRKFSSKRAEIQTTFSDKEPEQYHFANNFVPNATLNQNNIVLEMTKVNRSQLTDKKQVEKESLKKITLNPLSRSAKNLAVISNSPTNSQCLSSSKKVSSSPLTRVQTASDKPICPQDIFTQLKNSQTKLSETQNFKSDSPLLAKGYKPGQMINLKISTNEKQYNATKLKAIEIFKKKQQAQNTKSITAKNEKLEKILKKVTACLDESNEELKKEQAEAEKEKSRLIETAMQRKSINSCVLDVIEHKAREQHFQVLEKRERYENRLAEITELMAKVVTCRMCKYTAPSQSDLCKSRQHSVRFHEVKKRFFQCKHCKKRRFTYDSLFPVNQCQHCGASSFERTSMINVSVKEIILKNTQRSIPNNFIIFLSFFIA